MMVWDASRVRSTPSRRPRKSGWKPQSPADFPTLGWDILAWLFAHLPHPTDDARPLILTDDQARDVLEFYRLDPETGRRVYRRAHEEQAKGWGKSPFAAAIALAEFVGPVCFDGWDANGQPVGVPWGTGGRRSPWIQIAAVSESQTYNTWRQVWSFLGARKGRVADDLGIDEGKTLLYRKSNPASFMERVTASAGSREGQELTFAGIDEPQLYKPSNRGDVLVATILRNLAKTGGWALLTGNAPVLGLETVAELLGKSSPGVYFSARRPTEKPQRDWPEERLLAQLETTYGDVPWVPRDRLLEEMRDPAAKWEDVLRFFFNTRVEVGEVEGRWMPPEAWAMAGEGEAAFRAGTPTYACVRIAHDHRSGAVAYAQRQGDRVLLRCRLFQPQTEDDLDLGMMEEYLAELHRLYPARVLGLRRWSAQRPERPYPMAGPEIAYNGSFFERSAQVLKKAGMALIDIPNSQERIAPASEQLLELVLAGQLTHDGGPELTKQIGAVIAKPAVKGWTLEDAGPAALAAMVAVDQAMKAPREPSRRMVRR